jgi:chemotaxis protein CheC
MSSVEQAFNVQDHEVRHVGEIRVVRFRGEVLELVELAGKLGLESADPPAAVVVWGSGRRFAVLVDELLDQISAEQVEMPRLATGEFTDGAVYHDDQVVPILNVGALSGAYDTAGGETQHEFTEMQQSALGDTPIMGDQGSVLLVFPGDTAEQLCQMLGTTMADEIGLTALQEVGNILSTSYLNAIVEMTGFALEPEPPRVEVDLLGQLIAQSAASGGNPHDPTVLMRSYLTIEDSTAKFSFLFAPRIKSVELLLERLGVGV